MKKLSNYELESFYGGGILATLFGIAAISAVVAGAYKVLTSDEGKIKIPGGTEISFEKPSKPTTSKVVSSPTKSSQSKVESPQEIVLKQLQSEENTYFSQNENFLVQY